MSNRCGDLFWIVDCEFNIINANAAFLRLVDDTGTRFDLLTGCIFDVALDKKRMTRWNELYKKAFNGENICVREELYNSLTEKTEYRQLIFNPAFNEDGKLYGASCISKSITDEMLFQVQLETDNLELNKIIDSSPDAICVINDQGNFVKVNATSERLWGYISFEILGKSFTHFVHPDDQLKTRDNFSAIISGTKPNTFQNRYVRKDGSLAHMFWSARWDDNEKIMHCVAKDSTLLHEMEQAVENERQRYTDLIVQAPVFICILNGPSHIFSMVNPRHSLLAGKHDLIGKSVKEVFPELESQGFLQIFDTVYNTGLPFTNNEMSIKLDKEGKGHLTERYINFSCQVHRDACNKIEGIFVFGTDVTLEIESRIAVEEKNQRYNYVSQATSDAIWDWDLVNDTIYRSEGYETIFGYRLKNADLSSWKSKIHPDDIEQTLKNITEVIQGTGLNWVDEYRYLKYNREYAFVLDKGFVIRDENGKAVRMVGAMRDITKRKAEEERLKLLESVIINTNDAVIVIQADPSDYSAQKIVYVNTAFSSMTGYSSDDVIGKRKSLLFGPKSDAVELELLEHAMLNRKAYEFIGIGYKKNKKEYWINFSVSTVTEEKNKTIHWIVIAKDVTVWKNQETAKNLLVEVGNIFRDGTSISAILNVVLLRLISITECRTGEVWLINKDTHQFQMVSQYPHLNEEQVHGEQSTTISFLKGSGAEGLTANGDRDGQEFDRLTCMAQSKEVNISESGYRIPILTNDIITGFFILDTQTDREHNSETQFVFEGIGFHVGAEIRRKQLEQELNLIFTFAPDIISIVGLDGYFKKINPAACALLEYSEKELMAVPFINFIHPDDKNISFDRIRDGDRRKSVFVLENRYITKSGKVKWLSWTSSPTIDGQSIFSVAKNITDKKELENLLNKATTLANIGSWELDLLKGSLYWSKNTREIHEADGSFEPSLAEAISFYKNGENRRLINERVEEAINKGTPWDIELQIVTAKNNEKWIRVMGEAELVKGTCIKLYGSFQDIDVRKRAELAVIQTLAEKNIILESIGDAFFAVDGNWKITYWNKQAEILLGKPKDKTIDFNLWEVYSDSIGSDSYKKYHLAMKNNQVVHFEDYYKPVNKWYEVSAYPAKNGLSVYFKDVTERKYSQFQLHKLNESLQKQAIALALSNKELEQFAYVASHDLQEPLRMITSFLTQLERKYSAIIDAKGKSYIEFAVDGAKRMRQIILDLLEFSRVSKTEDRLENLDLNELLTEIKILFRNIIVEKHAVIESGVLPLIHAHRGPIRQVFQNLVGNALKYTDTGTAPLIQISSIDEITHWQFSVKDNGIGVSSEYFDRIFIIFQRLHTKDKYGGSGMGLAVTKKIIENYGGKIWLDSEEGQGSTFHFTLLK